MIIFNHVQNNEQIFSSYIYLHALKKLGLDIVFCQKHESFITLMWMIKYFNYLDVNLPTRSPQYQTDEICLSPQKRYLKSYLYIYFLRNWKTCPYLTTFCFCFVYFNQHQNTIFITYILATMYNATNFAVPDYHLEFDNSMLFHF